MHTDSKLQSQCSYFLHTHSSISYFFLSRKHSAFDNLHSSSFTHQLSTNDKKNYADRWALVFGQDSLIEKEPRTWTCTFQITIVLQTPLNRMWLPLMLNLAMMIDGSQWCQMSMKLTRFYQQTGSPRKDSTKWEPTAYSHAWIKDGHTPNWVSLTVKHMHKFPFCNYRVPDNSKVLMQRLCYLNWINNTMWKAWRRAYNLHTGHEHPSHF